MSKKDKVKLIKFWAATKDVESSIEIPVPAFKKVPTWYKNLPKTHTSGVNRVTINDSGVSNAGLKSCMPYLDAMNFGYIIELHCDVQVILEEDGSQSIRWSSAVPPISARSLNIANQIPECIGFGSFTQAWEIPYAFKLPKGYSALVTQPLNRTDLPTFVTSGIIDADDHLGPGGAPFAIRRDFQGVIPLGTPIMQIIPFKRDRWKSKKIDMVFLNGDTRSRNYISGWYVRSIWKKKSYQ
jgi:hypothetical protein